ncbi:MAG: hypothetical protein H6812_04555 [Phycisphaeraceae bacterium]|nr:hypothetical protein [Phycisphaerales bacterium]MCB9842509.1 hypothetical protein [Phycisphaeraceae bacterium]
MKSNSSPTTVVGDGSDLRALAPCTHTQHINAWSIPDSPARSIEWRWAALPRGIDPRVVVMSTQPGAAT